MLWDVTYAFSSNCLQMPLQRQIFLLSHFKTLSVCPAGAWTRDLPLGRCSPNWAKQACGINKMVAAVIMWIYASFLLCIINWSTNVFLRDIFRHKDVDLVIIRENTEGEYSHIEHEVCGIFQLFVKLLLSICTVNSQKDTFGTCTMCPS